MVEITIQHAMNGGSVKTLEVEIGGGVPRGESLRRSLQIVPEDATVRAIEIDGERVA